MTTYSYKAFDSKGKEKKGVVQADSARSARELIRSKGLVVASIESAKDSQLKKSFSFKKTISSLEL